MPDPDGKIGHADLEIGSSVIMLSDSFPDTSAPTSKALGGSPVTLMVYVEDVDDVFARAIAAGAKEIAPVHDQFYGDRSGKFEARSDTAGTLPPTSRRCRPTRWRSAPRDDERRLISSRHDVAEALFRRCNPAKCSPVERSVHTPAKP